MQPSLTGRDPELAQLVGHLTASVPSGRLVVVEGEPGVGKTRLLEAAQDAIPPDVRVLHARGLQLDRERPFGTITDALERTGELTEDSRRRTTPSQLAGLGDDGNGAGLAAVTDFPLLRFRVVEALVEHVGALLSEAPVVLFVEDLHWVDDASLHAIEQLARRLADRPLTIVATTRPVSRSPILDAIRAELTSAGVSRIVLEPLPDDQVLELAADVLGSTPGPRVMQVLARAAGNPLYVTELLAALQADGAIRVSADAADIDDPVVPASLDMTILARLGYLPAASLETLRVASLLGARFGLDDLSVVLDTPVSELLQMLGEPLTVGLLVDDDGAIAFRHDLVRDAIYRDLPLAARRGLHMQAARRFASAGRAATQVATHYLAGAGHGDTEAIAWLQRAAEEVLPRSPAIAAELLEGAVAISGPEHPEHDALLIALLIALTWTGRNVEAGELAAELETRPHDAAQAVRLHLASARALHLLGREREALQRYAKVVDAPELSERQRTRIVADIASASIMVGALDDARRAGEEACERGRALGDDPSWCGGLGALCYVAAIEGRTLDAVKLGKQAIEVARASRDRETARRYPQGYLGVVLMDADQLDEGSRVFDEGRRVAEAMGDHYQAPTYDFGRMIADFHSGRLDDAEVALQTAQLAAHEVGFTNLSVWSRAVGARIAIRRDDLAVARRLLDEADEEMAQVGPRLGADWVLWCRALLTDADGDAAGARAMLATAWELALGMGLIAQGRLIGPDLVRLLVAAQDAAAASAVVEHLERTAAISGVDIARAVALRCRGVIADDAAALLASVELYRASPRTLDRADTMRDAASVLAAHGRQDEGRALLLEALDVYEAAGARRDAHEVEATLRTFGVRPARGSTRTRPSFGWEALTPTELEVARLAAEGLSNPEIARRRFVSPRTIESHVASAFTKLGLSSRVALAAEVIRRDG